MVDPVIAVIVGAGGMGVACARRLGPGMKVLLGDTSAVGIDRAVADLRRDGFDVDGVVIDVVDRASVDEFARRAAGLGRVGPVVHTAGVSPTMADADTIIAVDLLGTAHVIDAFERVAVPGTVLVCIASMAGTLTALAADVERMLANGPTSELPHSGVDLGITDPTVAYGYAKRANQLRVEAAASRWGRLGARIVSVSPGIIATGMGHLEMASDVFGGVMHSMVDATPAGRIGTAEDIASTVQWLCGPGASFITGTDIRVDGGVTSAMRWGIA